MAELVLINCQIFHGGYDLSSKHNEISLVYGAEIKDRTVFNTNSRLKKAGLADAEISGGGFWDASALDEALFEGVAVDGQVFSISPSTGVPGSRAYMLQGVDGEYVPGARIGELLGFNFAAYGQGELVRGTIMENATRAATGTGTPRQLGAVGAAQKMYAALHVFGITGTDAPGVSVTVDSNDADLWDGTESQRITFNPATAPGAQWASLDGPVTDTWWRVRWEITGTNPSIRFAVALGIK